MPFVIDVVDNGESGMVRESSWALQIVLTLPQATKYKTRRQAEATVRQIDPEHQPTIREVHLTDDDKRPPQ